MRRLWIASGLCGYLAAALLLTWPLARELTRALPSHWEADVVHQLWLQWWFDLAWTSGQPLFHSDLIHFPHGADLQLADLNLAVVGAFFALERALGTTLAWNALLLGSLVLSGAATWALALRLCGRADAAWLAGLFFAASACWHACALNAWLSLAQLWVLPLGLLAAAHAVRTSRVRDAALAGLAAGLAFHVTPYYFLFLALLGAALAPWHARELRAWLAGPRGALRAAAAAVVCLAGVLPRALPMWRAAREDLVVHSGPGALHLTASLASLFWPWSLERETSPVWGFQGSYLGGVLCALVAAGVAVGPRRRLAPWLAAAALFLLVALGPLAGVLSALPGLSLLTNPWRFVLPALLCLSLAGACGAAALARRAEARLGGGGAAALLAGLAALHLLDVGLAPPFPRRAPLWRDEPAPIALALRNVPEVGAVLDLSRHGKRNQRVHGKAIVAGWLPRLPRAAQEETARLFGSAARADAAARADLLGRAGVGAVIYDDTRGALIRPDPARPGGFREDPLATQADAARGIAAPAARR